MGITSIERGGNRYFPQRAEGLKKKEAVQGTRAPQSDSIHISKPDGAACYDALRQKYDCVKSGKVAISGTYLDKCANDPEQAKRLEENLSAFTDLVRQGYENAVKSAQAAGGKLLSYSETWSIDGEGNLNMVSSGTVEYDSGTEAWEKIRKETLERMEQTRQEKALEEAEHGGEDEEEVSERQGGRVGVNQGKRARQIAAAKTRDQVQQVIALLRQDLADCKAGLENGWCDEAEIDKVEALLSSAQSKLSQVPKEAEDELGVSEFDLAGLM